MKRIVAILLLLSGYTAPAQTDKKQVAPKREVLTQVSQMPEFPGGVEALRKYLNANILYPKKAVYDGTEGIVVVRFVVSETGKLEDMEVIATVSKEVDEEALRVIKAMPEWTPGKNNVHLVAVQITLPINFELSD